MSTQWSWTLWALRVRITRVVRESLWQARLDGDLADGGWGVSES